MMGDKNVPSPKGTSSYSIPVGFVYVFNLIVGAGVLALPQAFNKAGIVLGTILLVLLCCMSYVSACYVIEAMAAANAFQKMKTRQKRVNDTIQQSYEQNEPSSVSDNEKETNLRYSKSLDGLFKKSSINGIPSHCIDVSNVHDPESKEEDVSISEVSPLLQPTSDMDVLHLAPTDDDFNIKEKYEMGSMANMFFPTIGVILYYICVITYLFGDLSIYAVTSSSSLTLVTCDMFKYFYNLTNETERNWTEIRESDECITTALKKIQVYYIYLAIFILCIGPFTFFNMSKTKLMQITTTVLRYIGFGFMVSLAIVKIFEGDDEGRHVKSPLIADFSQFPNLFGVALYSFMCQHSLPGIVTPMKSKRWIYPIILGDFISVLMLYGVVVYTAAFAFDPDKMQQLYSLDFFNPSGPTWQLVFGTYLALFPVFTLTTSFPIISVTLRDNIKSLVNTVLHKIRPDVKVPVLVDRLVFPIIVLIPPLVIAYSTRQVDILVSITGSFPGVGVQYIIPTALVLAAQLKFKKEFNKYKNPHKIFLSHFIGIICVFGWSFICIALIIVNLIMHPPKPTKPF